MHYTFPKLTHIDDVLPYIKSNQEFVVLEKPGYIVIDYVLQNNMHTFPHAFKDRNDIVLAEGKFSKPNLSAIIRRECRGLIFDTQGNLISRPFHKFFNFGERPVEQQFLEAPAGVLEKLDGSMIRPLLLEGVVRLATRKGITDVAMQAEEFIANKPNYIEFMQKRIASNETPIFEWCSRKNQIVLDYPEDNLVLLAIRNTHTGEYTDYDDMCEQAKLYNIPVVQAYSFSHKSLDEAVNTIKNLINKEGHVFVWDNGHRMKAKAEWYVTLHKAKEAIGREKDLIKAYLTTGVDDILPILPESYKQTVCEFLANLTEQLVLTSQRLDGIFVRIVEKMPEQFTKKEFAMEVLKLDQKYKSIMFSLLPGTPCLQIVIETLLKACQSNKKLEEYRWLMNGIKFKEIQ